MRKKKQFRGWKKLLTLLCAAAVLGTMVPGTIFSAYGSEAEETDQAADVSENSEPESAEPEGNTAADQTENGSGQEEKQPEQAQDAQPESGEKDTESGADAKDAATEQTQGNTSGKAADSKKDIITGNANSAEDEQETEDAASSDLLRKILENIKGIKLLGAEEEEAETFKVTFTDEKSLITLDPASVEVKDGNTIPASKFPDTTTEKGYFRDGDEYWFFDGWYNGTDEYTSDTKITSDVTLKAEWVRGYKITFHADTEDADGKFTEESGDPASVDIVIKDGDVIQRPSEPAAEGYDLDYWYTSVSDPAGSKITFNSTTGKSNVSVKSENYGTFKDIYVKWIKLHKVTFQVNYTGGTDVTKDKVRNGSTVTASDIKRDGYTAQWFSDESRENKADFSNKITKDTTFYAEWTANQYKILFDGNGGTGTVADVDAVYDDDVTMPANAFEKTGYTFDGWNTKADGTGSSYNAEKTYEAGEANLTTQNDAKVTLYAQWKPISYTVAFDRNDQENAARFEEVIQDCEYDQEITLPNFETERKEADYFFAGWCTTPDGSGAIYDKGDSFKNLTDQDGKEVVLYALWKDEKKPEIKYVSKAASPGSVLSSEKIDFAQKIIYTITITDDGTGVNKDSIKYRISDNADWEEPGNVTVNEDGSYSFTMTKAGKGKVIVSADDNADRPDASDYAVKNSVNNAEQEIRALVLEQGKPIVTITPDNTNEKKTHTYTITAEDMPEGKYSGIQKVEYSLINMKTGMELSAFSGSEDGDVPESTDAIKKSLSFTKTIDSKQLDGEYKLVVKAIDNCGNESEQAEQILVFDNTEPKIRLNMSRKDAIDGVYYYKADNCALEVEIGSEEDDAVLNISGTNVTITNKSTGVTKKYTPESNENKFVCKISEEDVIAYTDGLIEVQVNAEDEAGNKSSLESNAVNEKGNLVLDIAGLAHEDKDPVATFVLDTVAPVLTLKMGEGEKKDVDGIYYYNANNCGISYGVKSDTAPVKKVEVIAENEGQETELVKKEDFTGDFTEDFTGDFTKDEIVGLKDGNISISLKAEDLAGNESSMESNAKDEKNNQILNISGLAHADNAAFATFILDTDAPKIVLDTIDKEGKMATDGIYYYRKDNCAFYLIVGNEADAAGLDPDNTSIIVSGDKRKDYKGDDVPFLVRASKGDKTIEKSFSSEDVFERFADGKIRITIHAVDYAGNVSDLSTKTAEVEHMNLDNETASFIFDTTPPRLVRVKTEQPANQRYNDNKKLVPDNLNPYDNDFYYRDNISTAYTFEDTNLGRMIVGYNEQDQKTNEKEGDFESEISISLEKEGKYSDFYVYGSDKAGNLLIRDDDFDGIVKEKKEDGTTIEINKVDEISSCESGKVTFKYNKIVDKSAPQATIVHEPVATAYMYGNKAYISGEIKTTINIADKNGLDLDGSKLVYGPTSVITLANNESAETVNGTENQHIIDNVEYVYKQDGHYQFQVYGTDRAGNDVIVTESLPEEKMNRKIGNASEQYEEKCGTEGKPQYELIIDQTAPVYTLKVSAPDKNITYQWDKDAGVMYYKNAFSGTFAITETNYDGYRMYANYVTDSMPDKEKHYSNSKFEWVNITEYPFTSDDAKDRYTNKGKTIKVDPNSRYSDGVYRFAIQGEDMAGNKLKLNEKEVDSYTKNTENGKNTGQFYSSKKILDTVAPKLNLTIQNGSKKYYDLTLQGTNSDFNIDIYDPFRRETKATVKFQSTDLSPVELIYSIDSTVKGQGLSRKLDFTNGNNKNESMSGEQIFWTRDIKLTDRAGNVTELENYEKKNVANRIYLDVTPPKQDVTAPVATVKASTSITRRSADGRGLYNKSVTLQVNVKDPNPATSSSGLREVTYQVLADGRDVTSQAVVSDAKKTKAGTLVFFSNSSNLPKAVGKNPSLTTDHNFTITLPSGNGKDGTFETNNIRVIVQAVDNAGNKSDSNQGGTVNLGIDTIGPQITVSYDNNSAQNAKYFKNVRYATVRTKERNVDNGKISINTQVGVPGSWSYSAGSDPDGNDDIWTKTLGYTRDGDYTLNISGTDALGNRATVTYTGVAPQAFTIDRTAPVITVTFDNNSAQNGKYYKANRTATVSINEHNFRASDVKISQSATAPRGGSMSSPGASGFSSSGDRRSASIAYTQDGNYRFDVNYTDLAGNPAQAVTVSEFVIDKTAPTLKIENVKENMAYSGEIAPRVVFDDANFSSRLISFLFSGTRVQDHSDLVPSFRSNGAFGGVYDIGNIAVIRKNDDVYTAKATITDLAGNSAEAEITFSVNRFGSTYDYNDDKTTERLMDTYYTNQEKNLIIREINVNALKSHKVTLYRDGSNKVLKEGTDYKVTVGSYGGARQYVYEIFASNFEQEGNYSIIVQSEDEAGNKNTSSTIREDNNVVSALPVEFAVDKTLPEIRAKGASLDGITRYYESGVTIYIIPDDNMSLSRVVLVLDGEVIGEYSGKELQKLLEENDGRIPCEIASKASTQILEVTSYDAAGNESGVQTYKVLVTRNILAQFFNRKPLFFGVIAAVVVLLALLYARRKKKSEESEDAAA